MDDQPASTCVIGAGIIGSWAALHLVESGLQTRLLDQFPLPHTRGSSHGASRAFRLLGDETLDRLDYSLDRWRDLERAGRETLFLRTGLLNFGPVGDPWLERHMAILERAGRPHEWWDAGRIRQRFPMINYPRDWQAAWDPSGGILLADRCLSAVQARFRALGGVIMAARAEGIDQAPGGRARVLVRRTVGAAEQTLECDRVVVCCGPWTGRLLPELQPSLTALAIPVTYWRDPSGECSVERGFPILFNARLTGVYALPACEYPGLVKVLYHGGPRADPEARDLADRQPFIRKVRRYVAQHLPTLEHEEPAISETCMYTMTPDNEPIIDRIDDQRLVGCGFSGSGFKHSPASGRLLAALALGTEHELPEGYQLEKYAAARLARSAS